MREFWGMYEITGAAAEHSALRHYWYAYGGARKIASSRYFWFAIILTAAAWKLWAKKPASASIPQLIFDVVPSLLGLSIGAMAILSAFSESNFFRILTKDGDNKSAYIDLNSKFVHFIILQVITITSAILAKAYGGKFLLAFASFLLFYSLLTAIATGLALFGAAQLYNHTNRPEFQNKVKPED